jgi:hypothetical protein
VVVVTTGATGETWKGGGAGRLDSVTPGGQMEDVMVGTA